MATTPTTGQDRIDALLAAPSEGLNVEIKTWLDPAADEAIAKLVKALFALRNRNGGFLVLGFDNKTLRPDTYPFDRPPQEVYHVDVVQALVSRYANERFEIQVGFGVVNGQAHPVITVPQGVQVPVVVKSSLRPSGNALLNEGDLYFRTLAANGTASSAKIKPSDYRDLLDVCFDNREADIGRFLRRQLGGSDLTTLRDLLLGSGATGPDEGGQSPPEGGGPTGLRTRALQTLDRGRAAFISAHTNDPIPEPKRVYLSGLTMEVAMVADPPKPDALPTSDFLTRFWAANPQYTGWPAWMDTRGFTNEKQRARVQDGAWIAYVMDVSGGMMRDRFEFMLYDPKGEFYTRRLMQDDTSDKVAPGTVLDPVLMLYRVTEFIAAGLSALRGAGWEAADRAGFAFRWSGLEGRSLSAWANAMRFFGIGSGNTSLTDETFSYVELGLDTPHAALAPAVTQATAPLFACFNGYQPDEVVVEQAVRALVERRM